MNLFAAFRARFPKDLDAPFIITRSGAAISYGALERETARFARLLVTLGIKTGDRVMVQVEKSPQAVFLYLACLRAGAVFLPLNTAYRAAELEYFLKDAEPTVVVCDPSAKSLMDLAQDNGAPHLLTMDADGGGSFADRARSHDEAFDTIDVKDSDLGAILYSSGTTGRPKGVMLSHGALAANAATLHRLWNFTSDDVLLHCLPIFHVHGLFVALHTTLWNGTPMIFHAKYAVEDVVADLPRATVLMGVPTYYVRLTGHPALSPELCRNVRLFLCGSAPLLEETFARFADRSGRQIVERYGMTEAGMITSAHLDKPRRAGTVGWPLPDVTLRLAAENTREVAKGETGEIQIKSPALFSGYWRKPEKTAEDFTADGFFKTGDLAQIEPDGMVAIVGRAKDMLISGGYNVYPKEIETVIDGLPGVVESAVVGMPHADFGEAGLAIITLQPGASLDLAVVRTALKAALANYKIPKLILFADTLPRNAMGKVQKNLLRNDYRAKWDAFLAT